MSTKPSPHTPQPKPLVERIAYPIALLTLAAISSPISQTTLAPVFGAIPSATNNSQAITATPLLAFLLRCLLPKPSVGRTAQYLAAWAFWVPVISSYLFQFSSDLGPQIGPALIGFLSSHSIILLASYAAFEALDDLHLCGPHLTPLLYTTLATFHVVSFTHQLQTFLPSLTLLSNVFTPVKLQLLLAATLAYLAPRSRLTLLALPPLIHTFFANPHFDSARTFGILDQALRARNWTILDRQWSNTGYISVVESLELEYRVLRCDHSLLGGEWLLTERRRDKEGWEVDEPIYSVFEILEAVRLIEQGPADAEAQALVVGLGVGTTPKALIAHGINTTIIELDPAVHAYAMEYFHLPANHTAVLRDAVSWTAETAARRDTQYDYIIHDVFTGGAEPLALFTEPMLQNLRSLLSPTGALALNYAGSVSAPLTIKVLNTIAAVFGEAHCRIFRDNGDEDFTNIIVFCRPGDLVRFRQPTQKDFLGSKSRRHYMFPNPEFEIPFPSGQQGSELLREGEEARWAGQQVESAVRHWHVMRRVMPDAVWELW